MSTRDHMGSYIVRMYGGDAADGKAFVGIAQDIESGGSFPFRSPGDLWSILTASHCEDGDGGNAAGKAAPDGGKE